MFSDGAVTTLAVPVHQQIVCFFVSSEILKHVARFLGMPSQRPDGSQAPMPKVRPLEMEIGWDWRCRGPTAQRAKSPGGWQRSWSPTWWSATGYLMWKSKMCPTLCHCSFEVWPKLRHSSSEDKNSSTVFFQFCHLSILKNTFIHIYPFLDLFWRMTLMPCCRPLSAKVCRASRWETNGAVPWATSIVASRQFSPKPQSPRIRLQPVIVSVVQTLAFSSHLEIFFTSFSTSNFAHFELRLIWLLPEVGVRPRLMNPCLLLTQG